MVLVADSSCNPLHGPTDSGKSLSASILQAAAIAVAGINTAAAIQMFNKQWDIAKDYYDIAKWFRDWYSNNYQPRENSELAEARALTDETPYYSFSIGSHKVAAKIALASNADKTLRRTRAHCTGLRKALAKDGLNMEATAIAAMAGLGYRNERARVDAMNDVNWKRKEQVLNRGRNLLANNVNFAQFASGIFGNLGTQAAAGAGGALYYLGYSSQRRETQYPMTGYGTNESPTIINALADLRYSSGAANGNL